MSNINHDLDLAFNEDPFKNIIIVEAAARASQATTKPSQSTRGPVKGSEPKDHDPEKADEDGPQKEDKNPSALENLFEDSYYRDMIFEGKEFMVVPVKRSSLGGSKGVKMNKSKLLKEMADMDQGDIIDVHLDGHTFHIVHRGIEFDVDGRRIADPSDIVDFISKKCSS